MKSVAFLFKFGHALPSLGASFINMGAMVPVDLNSSQWFVLMILKSRLSNLSTLSDLVVSKGSTNWRHHRAVKAFIMAWRITAACQPFWNAFLVAIKAALSMPTEEWADKCCHGSSCNLCMPMHTCSWWHHRGQRAMMSLADDFGWKKNTCLNYDRSRLDFNR